jgi:hypothetical protein
MSVRVTGNSLGCGVLGGLDKSPAFLTTHTQAAESSRQMYGFGQEVA